MIAWSIAGSDSGGGAGIQADIKAMTAMGVHACTVITAVTAQNTRGVRHVECVSPESFNKQLKALDEDLLARYVKVGMLGSLANLNLLSNFLNRRKFQMIIDPVMVATTGRQLMDETMLERFRECLLPRALLLTPNIPEAEVLLGRQIHTYQSMADAARELCRNGPKAVYLKGGHASWGSRSLRKQSIDFFFDGKQGFWFASPKISRREGRLGHGTGCTLSSAIAGALAAGHSLREAIVMAKCYVTDTLDATNHAVGSQNRPGGIAAFPGKPEFLPKIVREQDFALLKTTRQFQPESLGYIGFYPLLDNTKSFERLVQHYSPSIVQFRHKGVFDQKARAQFEQIQAMAKATHTAVYMNDHWREAIDIGAYGVHLGQEDLDDLDVAGLRSAGLRLGISTHDLFELGRALAYYPSYIALGPIFGTTSKDVPFAPKGLEAIKLWRHYLNVPLVVIGGIDFQNCRDVVEHGADGFAMIGAVKQLSEDSREIQQTLSELRASRGYRLRFSKDGLSLAPSL